MAIKLPSQIPKKNVSFKNCSHCGALTGASEFSYTKSIFFSDNLLPICNSCIKEFLVENEFNWEAVDKICQYADLPFVPAEFERLKEMNGEDVFPVYASVFKSADYEKLGWKDYFNEFRRLKETGEIADELPEIREQKLDRLREKWGANYDEEELRYLQSLYDGILSTQNVTGALQIDQAEKLCKISLEIDSRIREGKDIDKVLASYDKLVKVAEFTPKNAKNASDFDSVGELFRWLEKRGWVNKYYDDVTRDVVDETIKNIQAYNQRLYINESGIGEEINRRIEALKSAKELEEKSDFYDLKQEFDLDEFENDAFEGLMNDNFEVDLDGE